MSGDQARPTEAELRAEKRERTRNRIADEIVLTEQSYVEALETIIETFIVPLKTFASSATSRIISESDINVIFSDILTIAGLNRNLLNDLRCRVANDRGNNNSVCLGDLFVQFAPFLKMYTSYASQNQRSIDLLRSSLDENEMFLDFVEQQAANPKCKGMTLDSFLIMVRSRGRAGPSRVTHRDVSVAFPLT